MIIRFNQVDEFIEELKKEFGNTARVIKPVLRMTCEYRSRADSAIKLATVVATIKSAGDPQDIIRLERYCGEIWGIENVDKKTDTRTQETFKNLEEACKELHIEVRAGVLEPEKKHE